MSNNIDILKNYDKILVKIITFDGRIIGTGFIVIDNGIICTFMLITLLLSQPKIT